MTPLSHSQALFTFGKFEALKGELCFPASLAGDVVFGRIRHEIGMLQLTDGDC